MSASKSPLYLDPNRRGIAELIADLQDHLERDEILWVVCAYETPGDWITMAGGQVSAAEWMVAGTLMDDRGVRLLRGAD